MEVFLSAEDQSLVLRNLLHFVTPLARNLYSRLYGFSTSVHWEDHVEPEHPGDKFGELGEYIVVEGAAAQGETGCLVGKSLDKFGVAMALIDRAVCR